MKLGAKLLTAPLLTAMVVLITGQISAALISLESEKGLVSSRTSLEHFKTTARVQQELGQVHARVYKTVALTGSMDERQIKVFRTELGTQVSAIQQLADTLATESAGDASMRAAVTEVAMQLEKYTRQADMAIDLASVDPNTGVAAMQGADATFTALSKTMAELVAKSEAVSMATTAATQQRTRHINWLLTLAAILAAGVTVGLAWLMQRKVVVELARAAALANAVAGGNLQTIHTSHQNDEVGDLMRSLATMQSSLATVVQAVRQGSENVSNASAEIAQGNHDLSIRTENQASSLEETSASMEELSATVKQNADNAREANRLAMNASTIAVQGGEVVSQVVDTMKRINDASRKIADIIGVIDGIAFQTNILALNAAVEAARAGEQGRGFAVVATEVRLLAGRSAHAAREIKSLIGASVERVEQGSALVDHAGATMTEVVSSIRRVTDIMGDISTASNEQAAGVAEVGEAVSHMDQTTQQNAALVEEMAAAASNLKAQAQELVQTVAVFKLENVTVHDLT